MLYLFWIIMYYKLKTTKFMKKFLLTCAALLICGSASVKAQSYQLLNFGLKAGMNFSDVNQLGNIGTSTEVKGGFVGGAFFELRPLSKIGAQIEVLYSNQGFGLEYESASGKVNLNYLEVPIMAKIYLIDGISANVGIAPAFLLSSDVSSAFGGGDKGIFSDAVFSLPIGASWQMDCGLLIDARYKIPLSNVADDTNLTDIVGQAIGGAKNATFTLMVGWRF